MIRNLLLLFTSVLAGFGLLEIGARFVVALPSPYVLPAELVVQDSRRFWTLNPGFEGEMDNRVDFSGKRITVTRDGSRTVPCRQTADGPRIVLIGDSQTFGQGLSDDETWANRLQCMLAGAEAGGRVFNFGVPGVNIDSYAARLVQIVPVLSPADRVIVFVTWNDLHTYQSPDAIAHVTSAAEALESANPGGRFVAMLVEPIRFLHDETWRYRFFRRTGVFVPRFDDAHTFVGSMLFSSALFNVVYPRIRELNYRFRSSGALFAKIPDGTFENNFRMLQIMAEAVGRTGAAFDVVFLPNRVFFDDAYYSAYSKGGLVFPQQDYPGFLARKYCPAAKLRCTTMFPFLKTAQRDENTFAFDGHYNAVGALKIAAGLREKLFSAMR